MAENTNEHLGSSDCSSDWSREKAETCERKPPFQVIATWVDGRTQKENAYDRRDVRELCDWFRMREKSDGLYVNRYVEGIGYVLDE